MNLFKLSHANPVATVVAFLIIAIMGAVALTRLPVQLTPNLERPQISILNFWREAAPAEMEAELVEPQERALERIVGLERISSSVRAGLSITTLTFAVGTDMQMKLMEVINAMNQVPPGPRDAEEPFISLGRLEQPLATLLIRKTASDADGDFTAQQELIRQTVEPALRNIPGVTSVELNSYRQPQLEIVFDPYRLAALDLQLDALVARIRDAGNVSGGFAPVGRREYTVRFVGQYVSEQWARMIVAYDDGRAVRLGEVAEIRQGYQDSRGFAYRDGRPAFYIQLFAASEANTVEIMTELQQRIAAVNDQHLLDAGLELLLSFDSSEHIKRAVALARIIHEEV